MHVFLGGNVPDVPEAISGFELGVCFAGACPEATTRSKPKGSRWLAMTMTHTSPEKLKQGKRTAVPAAGGALLTEPPLGATLCTEEMETVFLIAASIGAAEVKS